jgi:hypothetical protein
MCISFLTADRQSQVMKSTESHFFQNTERTYHCIIMPYIINVIADDETNIGLYEIYFLND